MPNNTGGMGPEPTRVFEALLLAGCRDRLAGYTPADHVGPGEFGGVKSGEVSPLGDVGPVFPEYPSAEVVDLDESDRRPSCPFESEGESADSGTEFEVGGHGSMFSVCARGGATPLSAPPRWPTVPPAALRKVHPRWCPRPRRRQDGACTGRSRRSQDCPSGPAPRSGSAAPPPSWG